MTGFVRGLAWLSAWLFVASGAMLTYEVCARYFFVRPTIWAAELSQLCLIWGCLIAMPWILAQKKHIRITAITTLVSSKSAHWMEVLVMVIIVLFSLVLVWYGWSIFFDSFERGRTTGSMLDLPTWVSELAVPVGFLLLLLQSLVELIRLLRHAADRSSSPLDPPG